MNNLKTSIIIVSYNSEDFIEKCILSVFKNINSNTEVIVLDNASNDKTYEILGKFKKKIKLLKSEINLGFGQGVNKAVKEAQGEYLFLLNPDTEVKSPFLDEIINFYENNKDCGALGVKTIMPNGEVQKTVKKEPTIKGAFFEFILESKNTYSEYNPKSDKPLEVEVVYAAALLIKKDLFNKLGGFSNKYFMYYEDVDLCKRIRKLGKKIYYYPCVSILHLVGATKSSLDKTVLNYNSSIVYHGRLGVFVLKIIFLVYRIKRKFLK